MSEHTKSNPLENLIFFEMQGKNHAIEIYDKIIWIIRSGYFTLLFGGWALALQGVIGQNISPETVQPYILVLMILSFMMGMGGFILDQNYLKRKYRVVKDLDSLIIWSLNKMSTLSEEEELSKEDHQLLEKLLTNSGEF